MKRSNSKSTVAVAFCWSLTTVLLTSRCVLAQPNLAQLEEQAVQNAVLHVAPSVVRIDTLGGLEKVDGRLTGTGPTTGLCVSADGLIVSSAINFVDRPTSILATLPDGKRVPAKIVARDQSRMLVLLKVEADSKLPVPEVAPRNEWQVGQWCIGVGRAYSPTEPNISVGILSAKNRIWGRAVQTDAKVSPGNYGGPLIDIRGRVIGVLTPLSTQGTGEFAGTEWYDSGIGFAVPLTDILARLESLKQGQDLQPGIMGVSFDGADDYSLPATIAACPVRSPAYEAGLRVGDTIVEVDGTPIERRVQLRHALGPHYAGDQIRIVAERGVNGERAEFTVELAAKVDPYVRPFLGILPARQGSAEETGVGIRLVLPDSPAKAAGLQDGDRLVTLNGQSLKHSEALRDAVARLNPGDEVSLQVLRQEETRFVKATLQSMPTTIPNQLPEPKENPENGQPSDQPTGKVSISIPEMPNECSAFVPPSYSPEHLHGLLVWLPTPGEANLDQLIDQWKEHCEQRQFILLVPQARNQRAWATTEIEFIQKTVDEVINRYAINAARIAVCGPGISGTMSYLVAFSHRDVYRGIASLGGALPPQVRAPATDPLKPLSVYSLHFADAPNAERILAGDKLMGELAFPVTSREISGTNRQLTAEDRGEIVRWFDILDQI